MRVDGGKVPFGFALLAALVAVLAAGACGTEAESSSADGSEPAVPVEAQVPEPASSLDDAGASDAPGVPPAEGDAFANGERAGRPPEASPAEAAPTEGAPANRSQPTRPAPTPRPYRPDPAAAPETAPASEPRPERLPLAVPAGAMLELRVEGELSTRGNRAGDPFHATLLDDVLGTGGAVLLPAGSRVTGRVLAARESEGSDAPAVLELGVESVVVEGRTLPLRGTVVDVEMRTDARDSGRETAVKVGAGAAAGALLGKILGKDNSDAVKGGVAGAAAGAAVAMATRGGHATVEAGALMVVRLDERLLVE